MCKLVYPLYTLCYSIINVMIFARGENIMVCKQKLFYTAKWQKCEVNEGYFEHGNTRLDMVTTLPRIQPVKVGHEREVLFKNKKYTMKTLSLKPPIFEIPDFFTDEECDYIIELAHREGLEVSTTVWEKYDEITRQDDLYPAFQKLDLDQDNILDTNELANGIQGIKDVLLEKDDILTMFHHFKLDFFDDEQITFYEFKELVKPEIFEEIKIYLTELEQRKFQVQSRKSLTAFVDAYSGGTRQHNFFEDLFQRIAAVTQLPIEMIRSSEALQVIKYEVGGHYHAHHDSENIAYAPCCHLVRHSQLCRPCRYATMFYYLNEPTEGGATAFPFADNTTYDDQRTNGEEKHRLNLSTFCHKANLVYKPRKGTVLFWYNHILDQQTGWLGDLDMTSYHGGCDVIHGVKWAANNWLNANKDREKDLEIWKYFSDNRS